MHQQSFLSKARLAQAERRTRGATAQTARPGAQFALYQLIIACLIAFILGHFTSFAR